MLTRLARSLSAAVLVLSASAPAAAILVLSAPAPAAAQVYEDARGDMTFALAGDAIITRAMRPFREPEFLRLRELIQNATVAFVNMEILFHDYEDDVIPQAASGGTYMRADPRMAKELAWLGFDIAGMANNHTMDFGPGGARRTKKYAEAAGITVAGFGENLALARAPAYLETPGGRVALVSIASTFSDAMRAGDQRSDMRGRPGLSPMRHETTVTLTPREMEGLKAAVSEWRPGAVRGETVAMPGVRFVQGATPGRTSSANPGDLAEVVESVREGKRQADWVILSSHRHEGAESREMPADFIVEVAHDAIDAGANMFVGHGPHVLRGIEIYKGAPIFYSLANFIFQNETVELQPADNYEAQGLGDRDRPGQFQDARIVQMRGGFPKDPAYWESVLATTKYEDGALTEVRLYPIVLGHGLPRAVRGRPLLAGADDARRILEHLAELSAPFGTTIAIEDGVGVIRP